jgi:LPXTG-site transpeptidase (sortase) family protein
MQPKISLKWSWFIVSVVGVIFVSTPFLFRVHDQAIKNTEDAIAAEQASLGIPIRLKIPKINVDSTIEQVGLTQDGAMDVPKGPADTAWFDLGPRPGETGSAVIAGHSGYKDGRAAVFDDLYKIEKGDKIYVENTTGDTITFVVRDIQRYKPQANAADVFGSSDGVAHLNLITCTGLWDKVEKTHSDRLVVFTDREI